MGITSHRKFCGCSWRRGRSPRSYHHAFEMLPEPLPASFAEEFFLKLPQFGLGSNFKTGCAPVARVFF